MIGPSSMMTKSSSPFKTDALIFLIRFVARSFSGGCSSMLRFLLEVPFVNVVVPFVRDPFNAVPAISGAGGLGRRERSNFWGMLIGFEVMGRALLYVSMYVCSKKYSYLLFGNGKEKVDTWVFLVVVNDGQKTTILYAKICKFLG